MIRTATVLLTVLALSLPATALAFDCSEAVPLPCDGTPLSGLINMQPETTFIPCNLTSNWSSKLYTVVLTQPSILTASFTGMSGSSAEIFVYDGCNESLCVAASDPGQSTVTTDCLVAGTYTVSVTYLIAALFSYQISATCESCDPVAAELDAWGGVKALYR
jgi:hypothetical protein